MCCLFLCEISPNRFLLENISGISAEFNSNGLEQDNKIIEFKNQDRGAINSLRFYFPAVLKNSPINNKVESLLGRRLLILLSGCCEVKEDKGTEATVPDTNDSAGCVWIGIGRSGPAATGSLA